MLKPLKRAARTVLNSGSGVRNRMKEASLEENRGYCVICEQHTVFVVHDPWLRDYYKCRRCNTIPRTARW
jgi:hypothetical protein